MTPEQQLVELLDGQVPAMAGIGQDYNCIAVFDPDDVSGADINSVVINASVDPCDIEFTAGTTNPTGYFDIEDNGLISGIQQSQQSGIYPAYYENQTPYPASMVIDVASGVSSSTTLGSVIMNTTVSNGEITVRGGVTMEGRGTFQLNGYDVAGSNSTYFGGTFIDNGTVILGGQYALGGYVDSTTVNNADLTVNGNGVLDLNAWNPTISSLNSSYSAGTPTARSRITAPGVASQF